MWFLAKIVFQIITPLSEKVGQFEEALRLVEAQDQRQAFEKVVRWGRSESTIFTNTRGARIEWHFLAVSELRHVQDLADGMELDSHLTEIEAKEAFIRLQIDKQRWIVGEDSQKNKCP